MSGRDNQNEEHQLKDEAHLESKQDIDTLNKGYDLSKWQPQNLVLGSVIFSIIGLFLIGFGIGIYRQAQNVIQVRIRYDNLKECDPSKSKCGVEFDIPKDMEPPVYFYYELQNFYQNHKVYLESFSTEQLNGDGNFIAQDCWPAITNNEMNIHAGFARYQTGEQTILSGNETAIPCGLIAKTYFNDSYRLLALNEKQPRYIPINETKIAWSYDKESFKNLDLNKQWTDMENEHFQVWMRVSPTNKFKKLWGRIEEKLLKGKYRVEIRNNYNIQPYDAFKLFELSKLTSFGGQQTVLVLGYIFSGIIVLTAGLFLVFIHLRDNDYKKNTKLRSD